MRDVLVIPPNQHGFKKAGGFGDLPSQLLNLAVPGIQHDIAVPFDTGQMADVNIDLSHFATSA